MFRLNTKSLSPDDDRDERALNLVNGIFCMETMMYPSQLTSDAYYERLPELKKP